MQYLSSSCHIILLALVLIGLTLSMFLLTADFSDSSENVVLKRELLPGTFGFDTAHSVFQISTDGKWLLFEVTSEQWDEFSFALYDVEKGEIRKVVVRSLRADIDGSAVAFDESRQAFLVPTIAHNAALVISVDHEDDPIGITPLEERWIESLSVNNHLRPDFEVRRSSSTQVEIVYREQVLAQHTLDGFLESAIDIVDLRLSPDGSYLAYRVIGNRGGSFSRKPQAFVLALNGEKEPVFLGDRVYSPPLWHPDGRGVFAYVGRDKGEKGIVLWHVDGAE